MTEQVASPCEQRLFDAVLMRALLRSALDETVLGAPVYELLDFWHLLEKLAPAAQVLYGEAEGKTVLRRWRVDLLNRNAAPDDILEGLRQSGKTPVRVGRTRPVHEAITYLENHRETPPSVNLGGHPKPGH